MTFSKTYERNWSLEICWSFLAEAEQPPACLKTDGITLVDKELLMMERILGPIPSLHLWLPSLQFLFQSLHFLFCYFIFSLFLFYSFLNFFKGSWISRNFFFAVSVFCFTMSVLLFTFWFSMFASSNSFFTYFCSLWSFISSISFISLMVHVYLSISFLPSFSSICTSCISIFDSWAWVLPPVLAAMLLQLLSLPSLFPFCFFF